MRDTYTRYHKFCLGADFRHLVSALFDFASAWALASAARTRDPGEHSRHRERELLLSSRVSNLGCVHTKCANVRSVSSALAVALV